MLKEQGLGDYYKLLGSTPAPGPAPDLFADGFAHADSDEFAARFAYGPQHNVLDIYVEGVHCAACLWLLEKLPRILTHVKSARLNLAESVLTVVVTAPGFSQVLQQIQNWGYRPRPLKNSSEQAFWRRRELRRDLYRIGVAAFCAGNVMLLSVALYAGVTGSLRELFVWVSAVLSLPIVAFSAVPLYTSAWKGLRHGRVSIDLPIVIAMAVTLAVSVHGAVTGGHTYFDSLTALVLLILASRFFLQRIQNTHLKSSQMQNYFDVGPARVWSGERFEPVAPETVAAGDRLLILKGEMIPVDAIVEKGEGDLNLALLTGESVPQTVQTHQPIFMGARLISGWMEITATTDFRDSRLQKMMRDLRADAPQSPVLKIAERVAQWFLILVMADAVGILLYWWSSDPREGFYRALSFVIVACPCTFASALPLVFGLAMKKAANHHVFVKDATVFERIGRVKTVFFDKTGVLTEGVFDVLTFDWQIPSSSKLVQRIYAAARASEHPVSRALARYLSQAHPKVMPSEAVECDVLPGRGIEARFLGGGKVAIVKRPSAGSGARIPNAVDIFVDSALVAIVELGDRVRDEAPSVVRRLHNHGYACWILSGDQNAAVTRVAGEVDIPAARARSNLTFESKKRLVAQEPDSLMIGDGNNDALALQAASVGIAMQGGVEAALQSSDAYVAGGDLASLISFLQIALTARRMVTVSLITSVIYNVTAGTLAMLGYIHPLVAAFIMPINAMTVFAVCLWAFREGAPAWK